MPTAPSTPSAEIAALRATIAAQAEALAFRDAELAAAKAGLRTKALEIETLKVQLARLRRRMFGRSSERLSQRIEQLELVLEELEADAPDPDAGDDGLDGGESAGPAPRGGKIGSRPRRDFPASLPRREIRHEVEGVCPVCGDHRLRVVGETVTEILDYVPGRFEVIRHIRPAVSCRSCESMMQAPMPGLPIARGMASARLIAHVLVSKFCDHQPLYRQSGMFARSGVTLPRSVLAGMVGRAAALMAPLVEAVGRHVLAGGTLHADDTPVPVLSPGLGKTRTGRQWVYLRDERPHAGPAPPAVLYRYTPDRKGERPQAELAGFKGALHADGYAGFGKLYEGSDGGAASVTEVGCWAHVRRKIHDVYAANGSALAREALDGIGRLFDVERGIVGAVPEDRLRVRQSESVPELGRLKAMFEVALGRLSGKSELAGAFRYALGRWAALSRYAEDGRLEISNNAAERAIRPLTLGRKN